MSDVVLMSKTKSECGAGRVKVMVGCGAKGFGGVRRTWVIVTVHSGTRTGCIGAELTGAEKSDSEIVRDTGRRANEENG